MNKYLYLISFVTIFLVAYPSLEVLALEEPEQGTLGGTGKRPTASPHEIFQRPEIPERIDIPELPPEIPVEFEGMEAPDLPSESLDAMDAMEPTELLER